MTRPEVVQAHLVESPTRPLHQMYKVLHSLCQSLQLEVLYTQTMKLISERLGDHVRVEEYMPGICLTVSYWRDLLFPQVGIGPMMMEIIKLQKNFLMALSV